MNNALKMALDQGATMKMIAEDWEFLQIQVRTLIPSFCITLPYLALYHPSLLFTLPPSPSYPPSLLFLATSNSCPHLH